MSNHCPPENKYPPKPCPCPEIPGPPGPQGPLGLQGPVGPQGPAGEGGAKVYGFAGATGVDFNLFPGASIPGNVFINSNLMTKTDSATYRVDQACKLKVDFNFLGKELIDFEDIRIAIHINGAPAVLENTFAIPSQDFKTLQLSGTVILDLALNDLISFETINGVHVGYIGAENAFAITFNQID